MKTNLTKTLVLWTKKYFCILNRLIHPGKMIVGVLATSVILVAFTYLSTEGRAVHNFKKKYPGAGILIMLAAGCFLTYTLGSLLIFLLGILLPFSGKQPILSQSFKLIVINNRHILDNIVSVIFIHASLRLRNLKNKLVNKIEGIGLKRTPMGVFLEQLGMEQDLFD